MANEVNITMTAKDLASGKIRGVGDEAKSSMDKLRGMRSQFLAVGAAGAAVAGMLAMFTKSALDQQIGVNLLDNALKNIGKSYAGEKDAIESVIGAIQDKTNFGDEAQRTSLTQLIALTGDYETSLDALSAATDLAAGLGMDFNSASLLLAKVLAGNTSMLSRYGITIDSNASKTEILQTITDKFGGSAEAAKDPITQLNNRLGDLAQVMGDVLLPIVEALLPLMETITKAIVSFAEKNPVLTQTLVIMAATVGTLAIALGTVGIVLPIAATMMAGLGTATAGTALAFVGFNLATGGILIAIAAVIAGIVLLIQNWDAVVRAVKIAINFMIGAIEMWVNAHISAVNIIIEGINKVAGIFGKEIDKISEVEIPRLNTAVEEAAEVVDESSDSMGVALEDLRNDYADTADVAEDSYKRMAQAAQDAHDTQVKEAIEASKGLSELFQRKREREKKIAEWEEQQAEESMARALEEAEAIVAASDKRYEDIRINREKDLAHDLDIAASRADAAETLEKENKEAFEAIRRSVNMLPSIIQSNINQGLPSFGDAKTVDIFSEMGANAMVVPGFESGSAVTKSVTGQFGFVAPTEGLGFGSKDSGMVGNVNMEERFKTFVRETIELNRQMGNMNPIIINGDVYGTDDFNSTVNNAMKEAEQTGAI